MKMLLSFGALVLAISASATYAKAACVSGDFGSYFVACPSTVDDVEQPKHRHEKAHHHALVHHVARRAKSRPRDDQDEKAPAAAPPPALPPH